MSSDEFAAPTEGRVMSGTITRCEVPDCPCKGTPSTSPLPVTATSGEGAGPSNHGPSPRSLLDVLGAARHETGSYSHAYGAADRSCRVGVAAMLDNLSAEDREALEAAVPQVPA